MIKTNNDVDAFIKRIEDAFGGKQIARALGGRMLDVVEHELRKTISPEGRKKK